MSYDFNNDIPIYLQIIEHIKLQIINKTYLPNQKIPSVRDLSVLYEVNPNTVQKALTELETMGLIFTESTNGKFVTGDINKPNLFKFWKCFLYSIWIHLKFKRQISNWWNFLIW